MNSRSETGPGDCLTDQLMAEYLEGALTPVVKAACEVHLIACDHCRENLAAFMRVLQPEITPQENNAIEEVLAKWDHRDLRPMPLPRPSSRWKRLLTYGAIASVLALVAFMGGRGFRASLDELVYTALTKFRPFEARLSDQPHVAFTAKRAPVDERDFESLRKEVARRSADSYQRGRFELLAGKYDEAVEQLKTAASEKKAPEVLNDLGVAYFNRNRNGDLKLARENLEAAIELDNTFKPGVFNLVLLNEVEGLTADANQKIIRYLELDPDSDWAQELRNRISPKDR